MWFSLNKIEIKSWFKWSIYSQIVLRLGKSPRFEEPFALFCLVFAQIIASFAYWAEDSRQHGLVLRLAEPVVDVFYLVVEVYGLFEFSLCLALGSVKLKFGQSKIIVGLAKCQGTVCTFCAVWWLSGGFLTSRGRLVWLIELVTNTWVGA